MIVDDLQGVVFDGPRIFVVCLYDDLTRDDVGVSVPIQNLKYFVIELIRLILTPNKMKFAKIEFQVYQLICRC